LISPSLPDLARAMPYFTVIAIFSHTSWRPLSLDQIKNTEGLVESLMFGRDMASDTYRAWLDQFVVTQGIKLERFNSDIIIAALIAASQHALKSWTERPKETSTRNATELDIAVAQYLCRPEIDRQFAEFVYCDRGIEFAGEMHSVPMIFTELSKARHPCIFDLRMCNSAMIESSVKAICPNSRVAVNQWSTYPVYGLARYEAVLQELKNRRCSYFSACERIQLATFDGMEHS
jgi:hypothetical protein